MSRIFTIANQKGGVGKTTTAVNLAASLAAAERRTLLVDVDPQGNAGSALGVAGTRSQESIYEVLLDGRPIREVVRKTELKFLDLVPASKHLVGAELELAGVDRREYRLKDAVDDIASEYEYVIVDCPPSLGLLTLNGLVAAQGVIIPLQCEYYALEGLADILRTIDLVQRRREPRPAGGRHRPHHVRAEQPRHPGGRGDPPALLRAGLRDHHPPQRPALGEPVARQAHPALRRGLEGVPELSRVRPRGGEARGRA